MYIFLSLENDYCLLNFSTSTRTNKDSFPLDFCDLPLAPFPFGFPCTSAEQVAGSEQGSRWWPGWPLLLECVSLANGQWAQELPELGRAGGVRCEPVSWGSQAGTPA